MKTSVIFLNGPTSVGKSSIARILQEKLLPKPYMYLSIDLIIDMMPHGINNWEGQKVSEGFWWEITNDHSGQIAELQIGSYAQKVCDSFKDVALTLLNNGHNLIIDDVCLRPNSFSSWKTDLLGFKTLYVGLSAPLEVLEKRETERPDRINGSARAQQELVHLGNTYDLSLDTSVLSPDDCSKKIIEAISR